MPALGAARARGDRRLIERLVANLLDNALRHNVLGGVVNVQTGTRDGTGWLTVTNDGPRVEPDEVERLYEPFERLGAERTAGGEGFGLGLCIVRAVADAHGASLETTPRADGGLRVEVRFPAVRADEVGGGEAGGDEMPAGTAPAMSGGEHREEGDAVAQLSARAP